MTEHPSSTAVLLINMGGPDSLEAVEPFLYNLFSDPDIMGYNRLLLRPLARFISRKRGPQVRDYYRLIGGKSPLVELTRRQGDALEKSLADHGSFFVHVAMRYWHPMIRDAVQTIVKQSPRRIIVLPLYPHYSVTTTGSSLNEFERIWKEIGPGHISVSIIREWHDHPLYIAAVHDTIQKTMDANNLDIRKCHIVFSAHGIPLRFIQKGDPYAKQIERSTALVSERLGPEGNYHLAYQSRVGPLKWLGPPTEEVLKKLGGDGIRDVILVPVSFVSDHLETLYEMDILFKEKARGYGITNLIRAPALNDSPLLIEALKEIVLGHT